VTLQEVADAVGIERAALNRLELNKTSRIDFDTLAKLCHFYKVGVGDVLEYAETDKAMIEEDVEDIEALACAVAWKSLAHARASICTEPPDEGSLQPAAQAA
jgi:putative transcriptional regulator